MAQTELANGSNAGAKTLAQRIEDAQTTVVDTIWRLFQ